MGEMQKTHETESRALWMPFRDSNVVSSGLEKYGQISWNPISIPSGNMLEIDVNGANSWLQQLAIDANIHITSFQSKRDDVPLGRVDAHGRASAIWQAGIKKPKVRDCVSLSSDYNGDNYAIAIDFIKVLDAIHTQKPNATEEEIRTKYGQIIDEALKLHSIRLVIYSYLLFVMNNPYMISEGLGKVVAPIAILASEVDVLIKLADTNQLNLETTLLTSFISLFAYAFITTGHYLVDKTIHKLKKDTDKSGNEKTLGGLYHEYLETRDADYPAKLILPVQTTRHLLAPLARISSRSPSLIRGKS